MLTPDQSPYRAVDRENYGWYQAGTLDGGTIWTTGLINGLDLKFTGYPDLLEARGPVRPVLPVTDDDQAGLHVLFGQAGRKTITTLAAALEDVFHRLREQHCGGRRDRDAHDGGYEYARRTMMAGRAGSWESDLLMSIVAFGGDLNLAKVAKALQDVDARRVAGPARRVDKAARDAMSAIIWRWVTGPDRYTEVAEALAYVVSSYCDARVREALDRVPITAGPLTGWEAVADQWLQPNSLAHEDFSMCYRLFCSLSEYLQTGLF